MPHVLEDPEFTAIALTDRPANIDRETGDGAHILLYKRDFSDEERERYAESGIAMEDGSYPIPDRDALQRAIQSYGRAKDPEATKRHIIARARALGATSLLPEDWNVRKGLMRRITQGLGMRKETTTMAHNNGGLDSEMVTMLELPGDVEKQLAEYEELRKQLAETEGLAKAERDARLDREFIAKAAEFRSLPITPATFGPVMKRAAQALSEDDYRELERVWKAADEALRQSGIFQRFGTPGYGPGGAAEVEVMARAAEIRKTNPALTPEQAYAASLTPEAYRRYLAENPAVLGGQAAAGQ